MVMWSHWNHVENKNLLIQYSDKLKWKKCVFTYLPIGHSYGSHLYHVICLKFNCKIFKGGGQCDFQNVFFFLFGLITCVVMLIPIPRTTYMHFPLTHRSYSPVSGAGRGSRGSWWSCLARCTSVQQAALSDHLQRYLQQRPHAVQKGMIPVD